MPAGKIYQPPSRFKMTIIQNRSFHNSVLPFEFLQAAPFKKHVSDILYRFLPPANLKNQTFFPSSADCLQRESNVINYLKKKTLLMEENQDGKL